MYWLQSPVDQRQWIDTTAGAPRAHLKHDIPDMNRFSNARAVTMVAVLCIGLSAPSAAAGPTERVPEDSALDHGYSGLYNLDFAAAQRNFSAWEADHPDDPVGPVSEAAGFLFSEFNRLGILESQFYANDETFLARPRLAADPALRARFQEAIGRAETLARARFAKDPKDRDALFAMTLASGLQADYAALIDHRTLDNCWRFVLTATTCSWLPVSANTSWAASTRRFAGCCGWVGFRATGRAASPICS
jgi:hypothetical protein